MLSEMPTFMNFPGLGIFLSSLIMSQSNEVQK